MHSEFEPDRHLDPGACAILITVHHVMRGVMLFARTGRNGAVGPERFRAARELEQSRCVKRKILHSQRPVSPPGRKRRIETGLGENVPVFDSQDRLNVRRNTVRHLPCNSETRRNSS